MPSPPTRRSGLLSASTSATARTALAALSITLAVTAGAFLIAGADPLEAFAAYLLVPLRSTFSLLEVLVAATPIILTGTAVAIAFRAGFWNIGAEGQLLAGAIAAAAIGPHVAGLSPMVAVPLMVAGGAAAGALWITVPVLLRVRFGIDEVVTTLLLNPVALLLVQGLLNGPWRIRFSGTAESPRIAEAAELPALVPRSRVHLGFIIAIVVVGATWYVLTRTASGLRMRAVGLSPHAARFAGIPVERTLVVVALASGAIAGIAGVSQVAGIQFRLTDGVSAGYGYTGIVVAMLGGLTMPGVLMAGLFLGDVDVGASSASRSLHVPSQLGAVVEGMLLLAVVGLLAVRRRQSARGEPPLDTADPEPEPPEGAPGEAAPA